jgi:hypothetical protein
MNHTAEGFEQSIKDLHPTIQKMLWARLVQTEAPKPKGFDWAAYLNTYPSLRWKW